jgi:hypothetical protein
MSEQWSFLFSYIISFLREFWKNCFPQGSHSLNANISPNILQLAIIYVVFTCFLTKKLSAVWFKCHVIQLLMIVLLATILKTWYMNLYLGKCCDWNIHCFYRKSVMSDCLNYHTFMPYNGITRIHYFLNLPTKQQFLLKLGICVCVCVCVCVFSPYFNRIAYLYFGSFSCQYFFVCIILKQMYKRSW